MRAGYGDGKVQDLAGANAAQVHARIGRLQGAQLHAELARDGHRCFTRDNLVRARRGGGGFRICGAIRVRASRRGGNNLFRLNRGRICGWRRGAVIRRRGRIGFGRRQLTGVIRAPFADFILQLPVLLGELFQLLLRGGRARQRHHVRRQLLFATVNALLDDLRVVGVGIELQILLVMINRRGGVGGLFFVQPAEFIMRRRRMGIRLQRLLERFNRALKIHGVDPAFAQDEMRLFFLVQRASPRRRATAQREPEPYTRTPLANRIQNDMT